MAGTYAIAWSSTGYATDPTHHAIGPSGATSRMVGYSYPSLLIPSVPAGLVRVNVEVMSPPAGAGQRAGFRLTSGPSTQPALAPDAPIVETTLVVNPAPGVGSYRTLPSWTAGATGTLLIYHSGGRLALEMFRGTPEATVFISSPVVTPMAGDIQWVNFGAVSGGGGAVSALKRDSSGVDFTLSAGAYVAPFLDSLNPGGLAAMDVVVPPGAAIKIQMYSIGSAQVVAPTTLGGGTYSGSQLTLTASGTPTWDIPPGRALRCYCVSTTGGTFHLSPLRLASVPVGTPYWWGPATLGGTASLPSPDIADPRGAWMLPATSGLTLIGTKAWTGPKTFTVPFYRTGAGTINAKITATTGTATLVTADGATVNGDGSLTIPADTHLFPSWTATDGATLTLTKGAGTGYAFYGPLYLDETAPTITPPPSITKIIPASGPDTGGTLVDIIGANLTGATGVDFGGTAGTGLTVDPSGGLATVTSPAHTAGPAPVTITTPAGTSAAETFTFEAPLPPGPPTLTGIDPTEGTETGGTPALITGTNLAGTIAVDFGGSTATIITVTDTAILVTTPAHAAGTVNVTATDGATTTDPLAFEFTEATGPVIDGPDVIANLVALLTSELGVPVSSRRSPTATKDSDPSVVVRRTGGPSKGVASDNPTVTIEAWAPTTTESFQLLQSARMVVIEAAEQGRAGLRRYDEFAGPADLPDPSTTNPRHTLTASVVTRIE